jgi:hypothetical protein
LNGICYPNIKGIVSNDEPSGEIDGGPIRWTKYCPGGSIVEPICSVVIGSNATHQLGVIGAAEAESEAIMINAFQIVR